MKDKTFLESLKQLIKTFGHWLFPKLKKLHHWRKRTWKKYHIHKIFTLAVLTAILALSIYLLVLAKTANVSALKAALETSTTVYDEKGEEAGTLYAQKGEFVKLEQISPLIKDAVVSTEDKRFYEHSGFDVMGIGRAAVGYLTKGGITGGGSTLTQQLAKNAFLTQKQTISRKAEELFLAIEIEKKYTKDEILEMYLNNAYFGNGVWGVEDASKKYFGKSASEVNLSEAAMITSMLKSPSYYNPIDNLEHAIERRSVVLDLMQTNGKITAEQANEGKNTPVLLADSYQETNGYRYPYYFDAVIDEAIQKYGIKEEDILNKGYKIYTNLNQDYQQQLEAVYENPGNFPENAADGVLVQSGTVMMDPKTGGVSALVGGRGEHVFRGFNRATQTKVQPGSTLKPITVYGPALENNYEIDSMLQDKAVSYGSDHYTPENSTKEYQGEVPLYEAVYQSLNAPAVWLLDKIGLDKGVKSAEKFGIPLEKEDDYLGLALGGLTTGVSPMDMASAYTAFANGGIRSEGFLITKIVDATGAVIVDNEPKQNRAISEKAANQMTSILIGSFNDGIANSAKPSQFTVAGKTGSTELTFDSQYGTKDQWVVGYTPDVVTATWLGFDQTDANHFVPGISIDGVSVTFRAVMAMALPYSPQTPFSELDATTLSEEKKESEKNSGLWDDVKNGLDYWGGKFKEGLDGAGEKAGNLWDGIVDFFNN
ncbi:PBP1A family penicillin-binding protein [Isobaculum melis]|uniref:Penicillin-binding protein 2A n=1 Tax=Isobaculum melis TaxID=142588 RepID=A0A1H9QJR9_9LACT|nr:PBP1A family penicillin-binding protein [Isobaculum melis]SER60821.1 penicillin-binding protein 2A [Isobaculum melis]